ncbi:uncharacterized protein LOC111018673 isoform X1 [Momordica charantia]|uniref:Uncharacterized protein LOC111018673 isoform X1 n=1 Tax=Momordica charantia TaxID=3673 RepID=A0A6J1D9R9_MOMCH|nr:uncharacterized protein LOC111018673 isoform X1 [Momordica charantia]
MGKADKERLVRTLNSHLNTIHETFQMLDQNPSSSLEKVSWEDVLKMGDQVYKQATVAGMVWTGEGLEVKAIEENMASYFNMLQGFLLISHGSKVGAGPTLSSVIHASVKQVIDSSFRLWKESVSLYGPQNNNQNQVIPQLVGAVWEACSALKKAPSTNITAVGRAITQVAVSVKDVLREMKELKQGSSDLDEAPEESSSKAEGDSQDDGNASDDADIGNDLSPEEMRVAQSAINVVSSILVVVKELIRSITSLLKLENINKDSNLESLENLLKLCQGIGVQVDELGACLYPPQEVPAIKAASEKISSLLDNMQAELASLNGNSEGFLKACNGLQSSLKQLEIELGGSATTGIETRMQNVTLSN